MSDARLPDILDELFESGAGRFAPEVVKVVLRVPILWSGWECDHTAWLLELPDGARRLVIEAATRDIEPVTVLRERLAAYRDAIAATEALLALGADR